MLLSEVTNTKEYTEYITINWLIPRLKATNKHPKLIKWYEDNYINKIKTNQLSEILKEIKEEETLKEKENIYAKLIKNYVKGE